MAQTDGEFAQARLILSDNHLHDQALETLAQDLLHDLRGIDALKAVRVSRSAAFDERAGDVGLVGQLALTFMSAGAATALIGCLKAYLERDRTLRLRFKSSNGLELELEGKDFEPDTVGKALRSLERLLLESRS